MRKVVLFAMLIASRRSSRDHHSSDVRGDVMPPKPRNRTPPWHIPCCVPKLQRAAEESATDEADHRISCVACRDPHKELEMRPASYNSKCQACHQAEGKKTCKVATHDCVACHMRRERITAARTIR